jgi:hypothetical protein
MRGETTYRTCAADSICKMRCRDESVAILGRDRVNFPGLVESDNRYRRNSTICPLLFSDRKPMTLSPEIERPRQTANPQTSRQSRVSLRVGDIIAHPCYGVGAVYKTNWRTTSVAFVAADDAEFDTREVSKIALVLDTAPHLKDSSPPNDLRHQQGQILFQGWFAQDRVMTVHEPLRAITSYEYNVELKRDPYGKKVRDKETGHFFIDKKSGRVRKEFFRIIAETDARQKAIYALKNREERDRLAFAQAVQYGKPFDYFGGMSNSYFHGSLGIWKPYSMRMAANNRVELWYPKPTGKTDKSKKVKWKTILEPVYQKRDRNDFTYKLCDPSEIANPFQEYQFIHLKQEDSLGKGCVNPESQRSKFNGRQVETNFIRQIAKQQAVVQALYAGILHKTERADEAGLSRADVILRRKKQAESFFDVITGASAFDYPYKYAHFTSPNVLESNQKTVEGYVRCFHGWLVIGQDAPELRGTHYCTICAPVWLCSKHCKNRIGLKNKTAARFSRGWYQIINNPRNVACLPEGTAREDLFGPPNPTACDLGRLPSIAEILYWNSRLIVEKLPELFASNLYPQWGLYGWR